jgi:hypothetical protein
MRGVVVIHLLKYGGLYMMLKGYRRGERIKLYMNQKNYKALKK